LLKLMAEPRRGVPYTKEMLALAPTPQLVK